MANVVQIKRSDSTGVQPAPGELAHGELAVNLADGILFSKDENNNIKKIGGDAYDLTIENVSGLPAGSGGKVTLNRTSSGTNVADGVLEIKGSDTVTVTRTGTSSAGVLTFSAAGGTVTDLTADSFDDGTKVEPSSGSIAILGGTGIGTVGSDSNDRITINIDSTVTTLTGSQTLTNKTLTSPVLTTPQINDTTADHQYVFAVSELAADRTVTLPLLAGDDEFVFKDHIQTLTNKTLTSPKLNENVILTATATELNLLDNVAGLVKADFTKLAAVDATATELNIVDGSATVGTTAVADGHGIVMNQGGTMTQTKVETLAAYLDDEITAMPNLVLTGALDSGSITSGFGNINNGASTITTTGQITGGALVVDTITVDGSTVTASGDLTLDSAGDIVLDADGANVTIKDAGASVLDIANNSGDVELTVSTADKNFAIKGTDDTTAITALDIDMALAGKATFSGAVVVGDSITATNAITGGSLVADTTTINAGVLTDTGTFKIDATNSITLDVGTAGQGVVSFAENGTNYGLILPSDSADFQLRPAQSDKDIILQGTPSGSSAIDMLKLDTSNSGAATFSGAITSTIGDLTVTEGSLNLTKGSAAQAEINFFEASGGGTNKTTLKPATSIFGSDFEIKLPNENGTIFTTGSNNILDTHIGAGAAIADSKLAKITTTDKVGGESIDISSATNGNAISILDADQLLLDDDGTTKRVLASQLKTYLSFSAFPIDNLNVNGGTDKATPVVGDEIILSDSEDSNNVKKADIGSILDIISGDVAVDASGVAAIQPDSVVLGTDSVGNYLATLAGTANEIEVSGSGTETAAVTARLPQDVTLRRNLTATNATAINLGAATSTVTVGDDLDVTGNLEVTGDLTVNGTTTTVNTTNLIVEDPIIHLAKGNNSGDTVDIGFFGEYRSSESGNPQRHAGLVRDASATTWNGTTQKGGFILFSESTDIPSTSFNHTNATAFQYGALAVGHLAFGTTGGAITAATTPHIEASGGINLTDGQGNGYTDGFNAPGELHFMTTRNCIIDCGSFDGS